MSAAPTIRPATFADTQSVLEITREVWEGSDYVPYVWHRWLCDPSGFTYVATLDGSVAGFHHIAIHPDRSAWMEGMRTAERWRGRGVAATLLRHGVEVARALGLRAVRLSTWGTNEASRRVAEKAGLGLAAEFRSRSAPAGEGAEGDAPIRLASSSDLNAVKALISAEEYRFYTEGWTAYAIDEERLVLLLATHAVVLFDTGSLEGVAICTASPARPHVRLGLLAGLPEGQQALAEWLLAKAGTLGLSSVRATVLARDGTLNALSHAGFPDQNENIMLLWERVL